MNSKAAILGVVGFGTTLVGGSAAGRNDFYPTEFFHSEAFRAAFVGSLSSKLEVEPDLTDEERHYLEQIQPYMGKDLDACINAFQKITTDSSSARFDYELGLLFMQKDDAAKTEKWLKSAVAKFEPFLRAHSNLGLFYTRLNQPAKAIPHITRAISLGQASEELYGMLGYCHLQNGNSLSAETAYRNAIMMGPKTRDWKTGLAQALFNQERAAEASALLDELLKEDPAKELFWNMQAVARIAQGQPLKAAENLEMLVMLGKATPKTHTMLGEIYFSQSLFGLSAKAHVAGASIPATSGGGSPGALLKAAEGFIQRGAYPEAGEVLDASDRLFPEQESKDRVRTLKLRSRLAAATDRSEDSVRHLQEVVKEDPLDGEALMLLADQYSKKGAPEDLVQAIFYLERALKVPAVEADASVKLAQVKINKSAAEEDKSRRLQAMTEAIELLKRAQELKKRDAVGNYLADLEKMVQKLRGR